MKEADELVILTAEEEESWADSIDKRAINPWNSKWGAGL